jgi:hypothetical protein
LLLQLLFAAVTCSNLAAQCKAAALGTGVAIFCVGHCSIHVPGWGRVLTCTHNPNYQACCSKAAGAWLLCSVVSSACAQERILIMEVSASTVFAHFIAGALACQCISMCLMCFN